MRNVALILSVVLVAAARLPGQTTLPESRPADQATTEPAAPTAPPNVVAPGEAASRPAEPEAMPAISPATTQPTASQPMAATTQPVASAEQAIPDKFYFRYNDYPLVELVRRFAQLNKKPLFGDLNVPGSLTFFDSQSYTYDEALDTINLFLAQRGYVLIEEPRWFRLMTLAEAPGKTKIYHGLDKTAGVRPGEIVTVVMPLQFLDSDTAAKAVVRRVSTSGNVSSLPKGNGLVIVDRLENIKSVREMLNELDVDTMQDKQLRTYKLEYASARSLADTLNRLFSASTTTRMRFDRESGSYAQSSGASEGVKATFDERTNTLFLSGSPSSLSMAEETIKKLDVAVDDKTAPGAPSDLQIFELTSGARADEVARTLNQILPRQQQRTRTQGESAEMPTTIVADQATNRILASAPADRMKQIESLIRELDKATVTAGMMRFVRLKNADAQQLVGILGSAVARAAATTGGRRTEQAGEAFKVSADARTNSLILSGPAADIQTAEKIIAELDLPLSELDVKPREIHIVQLKVGDARQLAQSVTRLFAQQTAARRTGGGANAQSAESSLRVEADAGSNSIIVACAPGDWPDIKDLLDQLKASIEPDVIPATRMIVLKHAKATDLAATLKQMYASPTRGRSGRDAVPVTIAASERANSLLISATASDHEMISKLVESLDVEMTEPTDPVFVIRLEAADAAKLVETIRAMLPKPARGEAERIFVQAEPMTNSVLIRAPETDRKNIEDMIAKLDKAIQAVARETVIVPLKYVSATALASMLGQLYPTTAAVQASAARGRGASSAQSADGEDRIAVAPAPGDKALVIEAPSPKLKEIRELISRLDSSDSPAAVLVRTYKLTNSNAAELAKSLAKIFAIEKRSQGAAANATDFQPRFEADATLNRLIVSATPGQFSQIDNVLAEMKDDSIELVEATRTYMLKYAKAQDVADVLSAVLAETGQGGSRGWRAPTAVPTGTVAAVRVAAMVSANAVIVQGSSEKLALAEQLIKTFDTAETAGKESVLKVVQLKKADAATIAEAMNRVVGQRQAGRTGRGATEVEPVTVAAEASSNSILVRGPEQDVAVVLKEIQGLDAEAQSRAIDIRTYTLANGDPTEIAKTLSSLFGASTGRGGRGGQGTADGPVNIAPDARTGTIVVSASAANHAIVQQLLKELDQGGGPTLDVRTVYLANADAADVAEQAMKMFANRRKADQPLIEADSYSNAVTIIATEQDLKTIEPTIAKLDVPSKMISVKVIRVTNTRVDTLAETLKRFYSATSGAKVIVTNELPEGSEGKLLQPSWTSDSMAKDASPATQPASAVQLPTTQDAGEPVAIPERPPVMIAVDRTTGSLIVSAGKRDMENLQSLITQLTIGGPSEQAEMRVFVLEKGDPESVAKTLDALFNPRTNNRTQGAAAQRQQAGGGRRGGPAAQEEQEAPQQAAASTSPTLSVVADARTRSIIVRAKPLDFETIIPVIKHLDQVPVSISEVRVFPLQNTDATEIASNLRELFRLSASGSQSGTTSGRNAAAGRQQTGQDQRAELIRQTLEIQGEEGVVSAETTSSTSITANRKTNSVIVVAAAETMKLVVRLIEELDQSAAMPYLPVVRMYPLKHAEVAPTVTALRETFGASAASAVRSGGNARGSASASAGGVPISEAPIVITGDEAGKLVIVSAPQDKHELIAQVIEKIDTAQSQDSAIVKVYRIQYAAAEQVSSALLSAVSSSAASTGAARQGRSGTAASSGQAGGLRISADRSSNSLIVRATADEHEQIAKLLKEIDVSPAAELPPVKVIPLLNADPISTAALLKAIFAPSQATGSVGGRGSGSQSQSGGALALVIEADAAARLLMVRADDDTFLRIQELATKLDTTSAGQSQREVIALKYAQAQSVATAITQAFASGRTAAGRTTARGQTGTASGQDTVTVVAETYSNSLIVSATPADMEKVKSIIEKFDTDTSGAKIEMVSLEHARAADVEKVLSRIANAQNTGGSRSGAGQARSVTISAESGSNVLVMTGPAGDLARFVQMARDLDKGTPTAVPGVYVIPLVNGQASEVAVIVRNLHDQQVREASRVSKVVEPMAVTADDRANVLLVATDKDTYEQVSQWVTQVEQMKPPTGRPRLIMLDNADPSDVERAIQQLFPGSKSNSSTAVIRSSGSSSSGGYIGGSSGSAQPSRSSSGSTGRSGAATGDQSSGYIDNSSSGAGSDSSSGSTGRSGRSRSGQSSGAAGTTDSGTTGDQQAADAAAANNTDQSSADGGTTGTDQPSRATGRGGQSSGSTGGGTSGSNQPSRSTGRGSSTGGQSSGSANSGGQRSGGRGGRTTDGAEGPSGATGRVETSLLPQQRSLLVNASDADYDEIMQLVKVLEEAAQKSRQQVRVFTLKNATNTRVGQALGTMFQATARTGKAEDRVSITALPQTNALVVAASQARMEEVAKLIEKLDNKEITPVLEYRVFTLEHATPSKVLPSVRQMLQAVQQANPDSPINVQADDRTKTIIVTARSSVFDQVQGIIQSLDKPPTYQTAEVLIVRLKKADSTRLAALLNEMLRPSATGQVTPEAVLLQEQVRLLRVRAAGQEALPELDLTQPIKITADAAQGSNSLVITSTPANLKALQEIVELMDAVPLAEGVRVRLVHLKNADATAAATVLRDIFTQGTKLSGKTGTPVAGRAEPESASGKALTNVLNVSADARTNSLVLSGTEETLLLADVLIKDLDRVSGKIVTEVRLFKLNNADATRLAPLLRAVFAETTAGSATAGDEGLRTQVTRLRTVLADKIQSVQTTQPSGDAQAGHDSEFPKERSAITIQADSGTNILIVAARSDLMPLIADVIQTMDIPGAGTLNTVRIFPLVNSDASRMATVINGLYTGSNASLVRAEDKPTVVVDTRTNALVVSASDKTFAMLTVLIGNLDSKSSIDVRDIRVLPLKNAEAAALATTVQQMMDARVQRLTTLGARDAESLKVLVIADARSNSLIIAGSPESFKLVQELANQLDSASPALGGQVQIFPLTHGNAGNISTTLTNLFTQRYAAATAADVKRQKPIILADVRTNSLLVAANADDTAILKCLLEKLDVRLTDPSVMLVIRSLKVNDAGTVGSTIKSLFDARLTSMTLPGQTAVPQDRVDVATDALSNSLIISASKENLELIDGLLAKVDIEPPSETGVVRIYPLATSDATRMAALLKSMITQGLYKPGITAATSSNQTLAAREKVAIEVDTRTNALIISASKENFAVLEELIKKLDDMKDVLVMGDLRMYTLKKADVTTLAATLQKLFDAKRTAELASGTTAKIFQASFTPDVRTNTLLVAGSKETFAAVEEMLKKLDGEQTMASSEFRIFYLKNGTAATLQPMLQTLFSQRPTRGTTKDTITVMADPKVNALLVGATPADLEMAEEFIKRLDAPPEGPGMAVKVFMLSKADATQVSTTIKSLYQTQSGTSGTSTTAGMGISVDERMNALVVTAGAADMARIEELVKRLDSEELASITEIRVFPLRTADATELAKILVDLLTKKPTALTNASQNRQTLLQFVTRSKEGQELVTRALQEGVLVSADVRTNSLVVSAPRENMPLLKNLIEAMDAITPPSAEIRVFALKNADATKMADVLKELFRITTTSSSSTGTRKVEYKVATSQPANGTSPSATLGTAEQTATLAITVDARTNSLLVGGTQQYIELVGKVIQELDNSTAQDRMMEVYRLRNATATDVQTAVRSFLDQEEQLITSSLGTDAQSSGYITMERQVSIVAEATSNTLLISASPRYFQTIANMIRELDQAPPQVLIQVLLAEVTLDDTTDLGFDWNYTDNTGSVTATGGVDLGVEADIASYGGMNLSLTSGDFNFFLRALQSQGRVEVLSRPQIMASDNQAALVNVGQNVPFITNSVVDSDGTVTNTIEYESVGIILNVTPRITPDGFVKLEVAPEVSSISESSVAITDNVNAIIINQRKAETTVSVQDGHTIVIGGLITTKDSVREDKVPLLGDIPVIGAAFKTTTKVKERTELLIILTPTIVRNPQDAKTVTADQVKRLKLLTEMQDDPVSAEVRRAITDYSNGKGSVPKPVAGGAEEDRATVIPLELLPSTPSSTTQPAGGR